MVDKKKGKLLWQITVAVVALGLALVYYYFHDYFEPEASMTVQADPSCDLRTGGCELPLPGGGLVSFSIEPENIPVMQPLQLDVAVRGIEVQGVEVDFTGVDMNMGFNRSGLAETTPGHFRGESTLPVCIRNRMDWEARVIIKTKSGSIVAPFLFYTVK